MSILEDASQTRLDFKSRQAKLDRLTNRYLNLCYWYVDPERSWWDCPVVIEQRVFEMYREMTDSERFLCLSQFRGFVRLINGRC